MSVKCLWPLDTNGQARMNNERERLVLMLFDPISCILSYMKAIFYLLSTYLLILEGTTP